MTTQAPVLEFRNVLLEGVNSSESVLGDVSFTLSAGGLLLILLDREHMQLPLADAASGLTIPTEGRVLFNGRDWREMRVDDAAAQRGRIGRLFDEDCWVANLDMDENLTLRQRHHTGRSVAELREEVAELSTRFQLPGLPLGKIATYRRRDLRKAACVRAFAGHPALILLERPTRDIYADVLPALVNAVFDARRRGAAVVWTTSDRLVWEDAGLAPTQRFRVSGARLHDCDSDEKTISIPARQ